MSDLLAESAALAPALVDLRRRLHAIPEVGLTLPVTQAALLAELDGLGLEISVGTDLTSVTAVLRGSTRDRAVLLRSDMDGLPVREQTGELFAPAAESAHAEAMHACGHDLHMAALVGAARMLAARADTLAGDVILMFQPGEEGYDGAGLMVKEGVLEAAGCPVVAAYALHVFSSWFPRRVFTARPGTMMAASHALTVRVIGAGAHGSAPHLGRDPIAAAAEMVTALQSMVTRQFDAFDPVVVTVGTFHGGTRRNVIPGEASFDATVRTVSAASAKRMAEASVRLCEGIAHAHGLQVEATFSDEDAATVNDADEYEFAADVARDVFGDSRFTPMAVPLSVSEDFSRVLDRVPGAYVFLGASTEDDPLAAATNHSPLARFDDGVLPDAAAMMAELAIRRLRQPTR